MAEPTHDATAANEALTSRPPTSPADPPGTRRPRRAIALLLALLLPVLIVPAVLGWALGSTSGARALLALVPNLHCEGVQGRLLGDLRVQQLRWRMGSRREMIVDELVWQNLRLSWPSGGVPLVHAQRVAARRLDINGPSDDPNPVVLPRQLILPLTIQADEVQIDELLFDAIRDRPVRGIVGQATMEGGPGGRWLVPKVRAEWDRLAASGEATMGTAAPLPLQAQLRLTAATATVAASAAQAGKAPPDWSVALEGHGPLERFQVQAKLTARGQSLQAEAEVAPVARPALSRLVAQLDRLDLAPFASGLPHSALSGRIAATLQPDAPGRSATPLGLQISLDNALPGRLDQQRLPFRRLEAQAQGRLDAIDQGRVESLRLELADEHRPAGQVDVTGRWALNGPANGRLLELDLLARFAGFEPARLHPSAPALQVGGPLALALTWPLSGGEPAPAAAAPASAPKPRPPSTASSASTPTTPGAAAAMQRLAPPGASLRLQTDLIGRLIGAGLPAVRLRLEAQANPEQIALKQLIAEAGSARLDASSLLERRAANWRLRLDSRLRAFDPLVWWRGAADHPLRRGPHRLDGEAHTDLSLPLHEAGAAAQGGGLAWLAALRGEARVSLGASLLAGVPLSGQLQLRSSQAEAALGPLPHLIADLQLAAGGSAKAEPSAVTLHADLDPNHAQDHWKLSWSSNDLQALAPWWRLIDPARAPLLAGDARGQLELDGRWPRLRSRGELQAGERQALRWWSRSSAAAGGGVSTAPTAQWRDLQARWNLGSGHSDPLMLDAQAEQIGGAHPALQRLQLQLEGQTGAHRLTLRAEAERSGVPSSASSTAPGGADPVSPAPAAEASLVTRRWTLQAQADGALEFDAEAGRFAWTGQIAQAGLSERQSGGGQPAAASATPLLTLAATPLRFSHSSLGSALQIGPTQLTAFDARLRLHEFSWRDDSLLAEKLPGEMGTPADAHSLTLRAELEPLTVAPLLARAQPEFGWGGDLQLGGRIDVQATPQRVSADVELQRLRGDLLVQDPDNPAGPQLLGLAGLRLALSARDGRWTLVEQVAGGNLGSLDGEQTVQAAPTDFWPPPEAPVSGHIDLRVAQLGHWGRWLPPGWRLGGRLDTHARVAGRVGAPELSGQLVGQRISVRNVLQGVDWRDAALRVALQGDTARIEQFQVLAGDGRLSATGQIRLGAAPQLSAQITAERFAALQRVDRRIVASGQADLQIDARSTLLRGRLGIDEGRFDFTQRDAPALADDVKVGRAVPAAAQAASAAAAAAARGPQRSNQIDLRIDLGQKLSIAGRGLATQLAGELRLTSPGGKIALHGDVHTEDGTYTAYGQKMTIDRGSLLFGGAPDNPRLDIAASKRDMDDVRVGVTVTGTAQNPRIRLFSEPEMTETDKLSYLLLGRASDGLGRTDLALLQRAAIALITGEDDSPGLIERIGLDQFSVRKDESTTTTSAGASSSTTTRDTVVSLGKQLSRRWYLGYERSLNAATGTWQLVYKLAQRFTFRAQTGAENALDLIWTWKWGTPGLTVLPISGGAIAPAGPAAPASSAETRPVR